MRKYYLFAIIFLSLTSQIFPQNWFWQNPLPQGNQLRGVSFTDANNGTVVGKAGTILRTTNGGASWINQISGTTNQLRGVSFTDSDNGTAVGWEGTILRTTNGGTSWISQTSGTRNNLYGVSFADSNNGTAVGVLGTILRTTNGGASWINQISGTTNLLLAVSFTDSDNGTAVGWVGTILRTTNGGVTFIEVSKEKVSSFLLMQNYPNPFNPSTTINYQIPALNFVTLKVYDVLGNEVVTLVNEEKPAGEYEVEFNASSLSSGIYFYRLQAGSFVETKKMVLLR